MNPRPRFVVGMLLMNLCALGCAPGESDDLGLGEDTETQEHRARRTRCPKPRPDASTPDASTPDASTPDASTVDAGPQDGGVQQTVEPYVSAAGIGVSDLERSRDFYTSVLGLTFRYALNVPNAWNEMVLEDVRGNSVVVMDFARKPSTKDNPVKLVFAVRDSAEYYQKVIDAGGSGFSAPTTFQGATVALARDPDGYLVELIQAPSVPAPVLVGVGIGVSSLDASADYYTRVLGMRFKRDIDVPGFMKEKELGSPLGKGPSIILMHYEDATKRYANVPTKIVFGVRDAAAFASVIAQNDPAKLLQKPAPFADSGLSVGMARDLDGYLNEIVQGTTSADAGAPTAPSGLDAGR